MDSLDIYTDNAIINFTFTVEDFIRIFKMNKITFINSILGIRQVKGNIPINLNLLNKYENVVELIKKNLNNYKAEIDIKLNIPELDFLNLSMIHSTKLYHLAVTIFNRYNNDNIFINNNNLITVSNADIKESINKIMHNLNQRKYIKEHFYVFAHLGIIIEKSVLVGQAFEVKGRKNNYIWNYYFNKLYIDGEIYVPLV